MNSFFYFHSKFYLRIKVFIQKFISFALVLLSRKLKKGKMGFEIKKSIFNERELKGEGVGLKCLVLNVEVCQKKRKTITGEVSCKRNFPKISFFIESNVCLHLCFQVFQIEKKF